MGVRFGTEIFIRSREAGDMDYPPTGVALLLEELCDKESFLRLLLLVLVVQMLGGTYCLAVLLEEEEMLLMMALLLEGGELGALVVEEGVGLGELLG